MKRIMFWKKNKPEIKEKPYEMDPSLETEVKINRPAYNQAKFEQDYKISAFKGFSLLYFIREIAVKSCTPGKECVRKNVFNRLPAIVWLKEYNIRESLMADLFAGITVGIMHIPQGMGFALLATLPPVYGLYTSFFPSLVYWIFGTSRQISIGTLAITSLMAGTLITDLENKYAPPEITNSTNITMDFDASNFLSQDREKARVLIAMACTFWVGIIHLIMFFFQLGFITTYLSEPMLGGFLSGSAIHVLTSQVKALFGIPLKRYSGLFKIPITWYNLLINLPKTNVATILISIICVTILFVIKIHINQRFSHKMIAPFPTELLVVIFGTLISYLAKFSQRFDVQIIGSISSGIPAPQLPPVFLIKDMIVQCLVIAIIAFAINYSLCDLFSKTHRYKINPTQELLAYGVCNVFSSFFSCFVSAGSLGRSLVQNNAGGKSQVSAMFSSIILVLVLAFIAPLFQDLPQACLASIILVALQGLLKKIRDLAFYWKINKLEFLQFLITYLSVIILDIDIGLGVGVAFYILIHLVRSSKPYSTLLGHIPGTELYKDLNLYHEAEEIDQIKIVRFQAELHATNSIQFKKAIYKLTETKPQDYIEAKNKLIAKQKKMEEKDQPSKFDKLIPQVLKKYLGRKYNFDQKNIDNVNPGFEEFEKKNPDVQNVSIQIGDLHFQNQKDVQDNTDRTELESPCFKFLIIDCSPIPFIDSVGVKVIKQLISDFKETGVNVYMADCNDAFIDRFRTMEKAGSTPKKGAGYYDNKIFHLTVHDAVVHALNILKD